MTGKEYLMRIRDIDLRLKSMESEMIKLRDDLASIKVIDYSVDRVVGGADRDISDKIARLDEQARRINAEWERLLDARTEARAYIMKVKELWAQSILIERYANGKTWREVSAILSEHNMADSSRTVMRMHKQALKLFEEVYQRG